MNVVKIENHVEQSIERLIQQYKCSPLLTGILQSFVVQIQDLEDSIFELKRAQSIIIAEGAQLDKIGEIVDQPRLGNGDEFYRILLLVKIGQNTSYGEPEKVTRVFKTITQATRVHLQEHFPGGVMLMSDGFLNPITVNFLYQIIQSVVPAGVRVDYMGVWDEDCYFSFAGKENDGEGFGSANDPSFGGCLAELYALTIPFAFDGPDDTTLGFGSIKDPVLGGTFVES